MNAKEISSGAEAVIYKQDDLVIKNRITKDYRIPEIDNSLRKYRTRREGKILSRLQGVIPVPEVKTVDDKEMKIEMEFIPGNKLRDILDKKNYKKFSKILGQQIAKIHALDIIHGDLTTSNFILSSKDNKLYFIDFGLSFISSKVEDRAVDLHLLRQALESKHYEFWEDANRIVLDTYASNAANSKEVLTRLEKVEQRGRNKQK
jgi:Kae1-associated kinase Bud32